MGSSRAFLWGVLHNVMGVQRLYVSQLNTAHAALPQLPYPGKPKATPLLLVGCAAQRDQSAVPLLDGGSGFGKARLFGESLKVQPSWSEELQVGIRQSLLCAVPAGVALGAVLASPPIQGPKPAES